jgi:glutamate synthase (NADPH/NADH) small chain
MLERPDSKAIDRKSRIAMPSTVIEKQDPDVRIHNFDEVYLPFDEESAKAAAGRCMQCPAQACIKACPVHNDIPLALWHIENGEFADAARIFRMTSTLPEICGRVCPQVLLCEGACPHVKKGNTPVPVGRLEAFVSDYLRRSEGLPVERQPATGHRVAVVGAGPAGLTVAELLSKKGHSVTVFEAQPASGGVMRYGIPTFKMDHGLIDEKTEYLEQLGVGFVYETMIGEDPSVDDLFDQGFEAVFLGVGAGVGADFEVPGVDLDGVYDATPFLIQSNVKERDRPSHLNEPAKVGSRVVVIGGGDTAMDCVRTSVRLGAEDVTCVYRRTEAEMPGNVRDRQMAKEEGVAFRWLTQPLRFVGNDEGRVVAMECIEMQLGEPDESGRRRPIPIEGSEFTMPVETVILALGYWPDPLMGKTTPELETHSWGLITIQDEETGATSRRGVFAGGDIVLGPALVVRAVAHGRRAAEGIHRFLTGSDGQAN